jgi:hypothetical protein
LVPGILADLGVGCWLQIVEVVLAIIVSVSIQQRLRNDVKVKDNFRERFRNINFPIGSSVSNDEPFEVNLQQVRINDSLLVVLMNLPCKVWYINSSVAFSRYIEVVLLIFWEVCIPFFQSS